MQIIDMQGQIPIIAHEVADWKSCEQAVNATEENPIKRDVYDWLEESLGHFSVTLEYFPVEARIHIKRELGKVKDDIVLSRHDLPELIRGLLIAHQAIEILNDEALKAAMR